MAVPNEPAPTTDARTAARYPSDPPLSCAGMYRLGTKRVTYVAALCAGTLAIGCGGDDDDASNNADNYDGTDAEVAGLVDDFANAARDGDGAEVCDEIFAAELAGNIEDESGQSCASEVEENLEEGEYELEIDSLEVEEDAATVGATDQADRTSTLHVQRIDGTWRIVAVTPSL